MGATAYYYNHRRFVCKRDEHVFKYKLTIKDKKVYQCEECGKLREEPKNVVLKLPKKKNRR